MITKAEKSGFIMLVPSRQQVKLALYVGAVGMILLALTSPPGNTQGTNDLTALSFRAYGQLAAVYQAGGEAPNLVAKLNVAIGLVQQARVDRLRGDEANAIRLEEEARSKLNEVINGIPVAEAIAERDSLIKKLMMVLSIVFVVVASTFLFYVALGTWRWYEKVKLFELKIVEKKPED